MEDVGTSGQGRRCLLSCLLFAFQNLLIDWFKSVNGLDGSAAISQARTRALAGWCLGKTNSICSAGATWMILGDMGTFIKIYFDVY